MKAYQKEFAKFLAESKALFFGEFKLKDGRPSPYFVNVGLFFEKGSLVHKLGEFYADMIVNEGIHHYVDILTGPSYKGGPLAQAISINLLLKYGIDVGFNFDRKELKLHGEDTKKTSFFVGAKFFDGCNNYIVDDVFTSGATKYDISGKVNQEAENKEIKVHILGLGIAVDREQTTAVYKNPEDKSTVVLGEKGEDAIAKFSEDTKIKVDSIAGITDIVNFLYKEKSPVFINEEFQPISNEVKDKFDKYMETYGVGK